MHHTPLGQLDHDSGDDFFEDQSNNPASSSTAIVPATAEQNPTPTEHPRRKCRSTVAYSAPRKRTHWEHVALCGYMRTEKSRIAQARVCKQLDEVARDLNGKLARTNIQVVHHARSIHRTLAVLDSMNTDGMLRSSAGSQCKLSWARMGNMVFETLTAAKTLAHFYLIHPRTVKRTVLAVAWSILVVQELVLNLFSDFFANFRHPDFACYTMSWDETGQKVACPLRGTRDRGTIAHRAPKK
jgi:hypothetical protein